jgi:hypothetical protein
VVVLRELVKLIIGGSCLTYGHLLEVVELVRIRVGVLGDCEGGAPRRAGVGASADSLRSSIGKGSQTDSEEGKGEHLDV